MKRLHQICMLSFLMAAIGSLSLLSFADSGNTRPSSDSGQKTNGEQIALLPAQTTLVEDDGKLRIVCFGAHPDDCELRAAGVGAMR